MRLRPALILAPAALAGLLFGLVRITAAQTGGLKVPPPPAKTAWTLFDPSAPPTGPSLSVNTQPMLSGQIGGTKITARVLGKGLGLGGYLTMSGQNAYVTTMVFNSGGDGKALDPGRYRVRVNFSNVAAATTISLSPIAVNAPAACKLAQNPGYQNIQSCDVFYTSKGESFSAMAAYNTVGFAPEVTIASIQVFKET